MLLPVLFRKPGSNTAHSQRLLLCSSQFLRWKGLDWHSWTRLWDGTMTQSTQVPQTRTSNGGEVVMMICQPFYLLIIATGVFSLSESEFKTGRPLCVPEQPQEKPSRVCMNHQHKWVHRRLLSKGGLMWKVHPNKQWQSVKKSRNNQVFKMIWIEVILPCTFDSNDTLYLLTYMSEHSSTQFG